MVVRDSAIAAEETDEDPLSSPVTEVVEDTVAVGHSVYVSNVASIADEGTLREFFSFCGTVLSMELSAAENGESQRAVITFDTIAGQETALLLDMAVILDCERRLKCSRLCTPLHALSSPVRPPDTVPVGPITVCKSPEARDDLPRASSPSAHATAAGSSIDEPAEAPADGAAEGAADAPDGWARYASFAALLAAGYRLGQRALDFVADFEARHGIKARAASALAEVRRLPADQPSQHAWPVRSPPQSV